LYLNTFDFQTLEKSGFSPEPSTVTASHNDYMDLGGGGGAGLTFPASHNDNDDVLNLPACDDDLEDCVNNDPTDFDCLR
jgi:hypothetical protein